jgi:hypothetical protein
VARTCSGGGPARSPPSPCPAATTWRTRRRRAAVGGGGWEISKCLRPEGEERGAGGGEGEFEILGVAAAARCGAADLCYAAVGWAALQVCELGSAQ